MNSRIDGSGRACQRPRTSSGAKCFSCAGALAKDPQIFKFLAINVAPPEATPSRFALSSFRYAPLRPANQLRPAQHKKWRVLHGNLFLKLLFSFLGLYCKFHSKPVLRCPRPRPRHLAPLRSASLHRPRSARAPLGGQMRSALAQPYS